MYFDNLQEFYLIQKRLIPLMNDFGIKSEDFNFNINNEENLEIINNDNINPIEIKE